MNIQEQIKAVLLKVIQEAGALISGRFNGSFSVGHKEGVNNLVTEMDQAAERLITTVIREHYPDHGIVGEEYGATAGDARYKWVIDPIDGTVNYAHGIPIFSVSIGVVEHDTIILGAVYNPMMNELFFAQKGKGAFLNGQPIHVSAQADLERAFLVTGFPYHFPEGKDPFRIFERLVNRGIPVRRLGSAALDLCWVACGRFDGFWEYNLFPWDITAGYLIVEEAGGKVTNFQGEPGRIGDQETLATNGRIHEALRLAINE